MNQPYVFDTEALIAFFYQEEGHSIIRSLLAEVSSGEINGYIAEINATETLYLLARYNGRDGKPTPDSLHIAEQQIRGLQMQGITITVPSWQLAAKIKAHGNISLADAYAAALSHEREATLVVGADDDFQDLPVSVELLRFRDTAV